jgi:hypothetical protein
MLIKKGYSSGDIACFKISNGDEVVAKIVEETDTGFVVSKPCTIIPSQQGIGLMQTLISADINTDITLNKVHIIMSAPVITDIENHYIRTTTGIQPAKSGIIT